MNWNDFFLHGIGGLALAGGVGGALVTLTHEILKVVIGKLKAKTAAEPPTTTTKVEGVALEVADQAVDIATKAAQEALAQKK